MNLEQTLWFKKGIKAAVAGTQATTPDSRKADAWIKDYLDKKQKRLNDLRVQMNTLLGPEKGEVHGSWREDKPPVWEQMPQRAAGGGKYAVVDPEGRIISTWQTEEEAENAAYALWKGIAPSSTGATAGARVQKIEAEDVFSDPELMEQGRRDYIGHEKPDPVKLADWLRDGDQRPSSGGGAAGTGGAGGGGGF